MALTIWRGIFIQLIIANPKDPPIIHLLPFPPSVAQPGQPLQQLVAVRDRCLADPEIQQAVSEQRQHQQQQTEQPQQLTGGESQPSRAKAAPNSRSWASRRFSAARNTASRAEASPGSSTPDSASLTAESTQASTSR